MSLGLVQKLHFTLYHNNTKMSLPQEPCFMTDHFYFKEFRKLLPKEHSCKIIMPSNQWFGSLKVFILGLP